jgi:hypothetical protein
LQFVLRSRLECLLDLRGKALGKFGGHARFTVAPFDFLMKNDSAIAHKVWLFAAMTALILRAVGLSSAG